MLTNPPGKHPENILRPACENDDFLRVIRIPCEDVPEFSIVNFRVRPGNTGGEFYSADYPGALRNTVETLCPNTKCIFINGAEGQMVCSNAQAPRIKTSHEKAVAFGEKLGRRVAELAKDAVSTGMTGLS